MESRADGTDFLKVVSTNFVYLNGDEIPSHQYSVTRYERNLKEGNAPGRDEHGRMCFATRRQNRYDADTADMTSHGMMGSPGVFFNYEISPMKVFHTETRQSFAHFLTSCVHPTLAHARHRISIFGIAH